MNVHVKRSNGVLKVEIDGRLYPPLSFKSFRPNPQNVSEFYDAGVRLFSVLTSGITSALGVPYSLYGESWIGEDTYDFSAIDRQMDMFLENAPEGYFAPMIQLDTRPWYLQQHPEVPNSFTHLSQIACDDGWKQAAAAYLKATIRHCEEKYGDRIYGYFLLCGTTTEWFSEWDHEASHPIKEAGYRKWLGRADAALPSLARLNQKGDVFLEPGEADVYQARKFHSELIADLILYFAGEAQSVLHHEKLLGLYYGYLFELGGERLFDDGSLGYEKVYRSPDIDMISSPSAYGYRKLTDPSAFMVTQKTLDAHNKLYFLEFDHITHVAPEMITDGLDEQSSNKIMVKIPGADSKCKNETESLNLMYRDFLLCNANLAAMWWFDMFDGWFRSEGMMTAVRNMLQIAEKLSEHSTETTAEIAVFAEGESMYRVRKSGGIATVCLSDIRRTLAECGAAYDLYSISDLGLPQIRQYKLLLFVNQYDLSERTQSQLRQLLSEGERTVLWLYAPGYVTGGALDVNHICETTGIRVEESHQSHGGVVFGNQTMAFTLAPPYFRVNDLAAQPLAYFEDGSVAAAWKERKWGKSVYLATCNLPSELLREIARLAGAFVYSETAQVYTYPNSVSLGVYNATGKDAVIHVKENGCYQDLISGKKYQAADGRLVIPQSDIRAYLLVKQEDPAGSRRERSD